MGRETRLHPSMGLHDDRSRARRGRGPAHARVLGNAYERWRSSSPILHARERFGVAHRAGLALRLQGRVMRRVAALYVDERGPYPAMRVPRSALEAPPFPGREPTHWLSGSRGKSSRTGNPVPPGIKVCSAAQRRRTPPLFAEYLVRLARSAT